MNIIYAEYNMYHNDIDIYTYAEYRSFISFSITFFDIFLKIDCNISRETPIFNNGGVIMAENTGLTIDEAVIYYLCFRGRCIEYGIIW